MLRTTPSPASREKGNAPPFPARSGAKFGDLVVAKFMNTIMYEGKKSIAEAIVYGRFRLSVRARAQLINIYDFSVATFGAYQAEAYYAA
jgi:ribosomal protein S7